MNSEPELPWASRRVRRELARVSLLPLINHYGFQNPIEQKLMIVALQFMMGRGVSLLMLLNIVSFREAAGRRESLEQLVRANAPWDHETDNADHYEFCGWITELLWRALKAWRFLTGRNHDQNYDKADFTHQLLNELKEDETAVKDAYAAMGKD